MRLKAAGSGLMAFATLPAASAQTPGDLHQTVSPDQYRGMPLKQRQLYVASALDADRVFYQQTTQMFACLNGVTLAQATDIVDRGLTTLPPLASWTMPAVVHNALLNACNGGK